MKSRAPKMSSMSSAETVADIDELLKQILVRLPALSLLRFKSVSKRWLSLISDPDFRLQNPKTSAFFDDSFISVHLQLQQPGRNPFKALHDSAPDASIFRILQSCNGLFLCHIPYAFSKHRKLHPVFVVNPTTNRFRALSPPGVTVSETILRNGFVRYGLAFDPSRSPHYKVVCINSYRDGRHEIEIYSSETGGWKKKQLNAPFFPKPMEFDSRSREGAVYCDGAVHWIRSRANAGLSWGSIRTGDGPWSRDECDVLHYFNFGEERLGVAPVAPPVPLVVKNIALQEGGTFGGDGIFPTEWPTLASRYLGECGGRLCLIETYKHCMTEFDVMEMESDYSGWLVKYNVDLNPLVAAALRRRIPIAFVILGLVQEDQTYFEVEGTSTDLLLHLPGKVISYNLVTKTFKTCVKLARRKLFLGLGDKHNDWEGFAFPYRETLASL
ncbi:F-box protein At5g07610-like [Argentina anserina]|uniref:F-box protein At5g07610-like n=1 Tax=Argentina anserina TaxID=57926 RepID=UPI0021762939|nr:F-box protein At5g07610-like [Potentilla anserina]